MGYRKVIVMVLAAIKTRSYGAPYFIQNGAIVLPYVAAGGDQFIFVDENALIKHRKLLAI